MEESCGKESGEDAENEDTEQDVFEDTHSLHDTPWLATPCGSVFFRFQTRLCEEVEWFTPKDDIVLETAPALR